LKERKYNAIMGILKRSRKRSGLTIKEITERCGFKANITRAYLSRLTKEGKIERPMRGMYRRKEVE